MRNSVCRLLSVPILFVGLVLSGTAHAQDMGAGQDGMGPQVTVNLYATLEFKNFKNSDSAFDARNIELLANGRLHSRLTGSAEIEFERTKAVGEGFGAVEVEQGWVQYEVASYLKIRSGVILVPFGNYNLTHFDPFQDLTDRPLMATKVVPTTWAEAGAGFVGSVFPTDNSVIDYQFYVVNGLTDMIGDDEGLREARPGFEEDNNNNKAMVARIAGSMGRNELGVSGYRGAYDADQNMATGVDVDGLLVFGPLEVLGEWAMFNFDKGFNSDTGLEVPEDLMGWYAQANLHFWFDFLNSTFLGREFEDPTFTLVFRYGQADNADDGDGSGVGNEKDNKETRTTVGINYRPTETFVFKVEYQNNKTDSESLEHGDNDGVLASATAAF